MIPSIYIYNMTCSEFHDLIDGYKQMNGNASNSYMPIIMEVTLYVFGHCSAMSNFYYVAVAV